MRCGTAAHDAQGARGRVAVTRRVSRDPVGLPRRGARPGRCVARWARGQGAQPGRVRRGEPSEPSPPWHQAPAAERLVDRRRDDGRGLAIPAAPVEPPHPSLTSDRARRARPLVVDRALAHPQRRVGVNTGCSSAEVPPPQPTKSCDAARRGAGGVRPSLPAWEVAHLSSVDLSFGGLPEVVAHEAIPAGRYPECALADEYDHQEDKRDCPSSGSRVQPPEDDGADRRHDVSD